MEMKSLNIDFGLKAKVWPEAESRESKIFVEKIFLFLQRGIF